MKTHRRRVRKQWPRRAALALAALLAGAAGAEAGDVKYRIVGTVPFPADAPPRRGADADRRLQEPKPAWVDDTYWDQLVFNLLDEPDQDKNVIRTRGLTSEELSGLQIYIKTSSPNSDIQPISDDMVRWWMTAFPDAVRKFTGGAWSGSITTGTDAGDTETDGRVNVRLGTKADFEDSPDACAFASTAFYAFPDGSFAEWARSEIVISPTAQTECSIYNDSEGRTMAHEMGHVLGLSHVDDASDIMFGSETPDNRYTKRLTDHAQLMYRTGSTAKYPGFVKDAFTQPRWTSYMRDFAYDADKQAFTGKISHDGGGESKPTSRFVWEFRFHDAGGRRLDNGEHVGRYTEELARTPWQLIFDTDPAMGGFTPPANWDVVEITVRAKTPTLAQEFAMDCVDGDERGSRGTVDFVGEDFSSCRYTRAQAETPPAPEPEPPPEPVPALPLAALGLLAAGLLAGGARALRRRI